MRTRTLLPLSPLPLSLVPPPRRSPGRAIPAAGTAGVGSHRVSLAARCRPIGYLPWIVALLAGPLLPNPGLAQAAEHPASAVQAANADTARAAGLRVVPGRHLTLLTDLPPRPAIDRIPAVFDQAVPQWAAYFGLSPEQLDDWRVLGCLMGQADRFKAAGLLPSDLPPFPFAFQRGDQIWVHDQASDYYRQHLVLHEGTHAVMQHALGGTGPPWFMEGIAELLATHHWHDGSLQLGHFPEHRDQVPLWGRIKLVRDRVAQAQPLTLEQILAYGPRAHQQVEPYGWCWAVCTLLERHPQFQPRFRQLCRAVAASPPQFEAEMRRLLADDWDDLRLAWQLMLADLDYGYDVGQAGVEPSAVRPQADGSWLVSLRADRSWQTTGISLVAGQAYRLTASGRFVLAQQPRAWICEPQGVTIRYFRGRPLGELAAIVVPEGADGWPALAPVPVGRRADLRPTTTGQLLLRINEMPGQLHDNSGRLQVHVGAVSLPAAD